MSAPGSRNVLCCARAGRGHLPQRLSAWGCGPLRPGAITGKAHYSIGGLEAPWHRPLGAPIETLLWDFPPPNIRESPARGALVRVLRVTEHALNSPREG